MTAHSLNALPAELRNEVVAALQERPKRQAAEAQVKILMEELRLLRAYRFGRSSEKLSDGQIDLFTNAIFAANVPAAETPGAAKEKPARKSRPNHPGRHPFPAHLERIDEPVALSEEERTCDHCGGEMDVIGIETREELEEVPAQLRVRAFHHEVGKCPCCTDKPMMAEGPDRLIPGGSAGPSIHARVIVDKFVDHQPLDRQERKFKREDIYISRKTMSGWLKQLFPFMELIANDIRLELLAGDYLQADETPVPMQSADKIGKHHQSYFWGYNRPDGPIYFEFRTDRSRAGPAKMLAGYGGILQHDGYTAYLKVGREPTHVACMAHIRRTFFEAEKAGDPRARRIVRMIGWLYKQERKARKEQLSAEERHTLRQGRSQKIMHVLERRITRMALDPDITPGSKLGKACAYALGQWSHMKNYPSDARIEIDNNLMENEIRPITLGRKNWLSIGSELGGEMAAVYLTLVANCKRLQINPRTYLEDVMRRLPGHDQTRIHELTPAAWKAEQAAKNA